MARAGDLQALESASWFWVESLRHNPRNYNDLYALAVASEALGRTDDAISAYEVACAIVPSNGGPQTYRGVLLLRRVWGAPLPSPPEKRQSADARGRISMSTLGRMGRFGNQIFQYGFLRLYGRIHGLQVEVPDWVGRWLFDLDDPYPGAPLRPLNENRHLMGAFLGERSRPSWRTTICRATCNATPGTFGITRRCSEGCSNQARGCGRWWTVRWRA